MVFSTPVRVNPAVAWCLWIVGVAVFPIVALLVPRDGNAVAIANFIPGSRGLEVWLGWAIGFALMFVGMLLLRTASVRTVFLAQAIAGVVCAVSTTAVPSTDAYGYFVYGRWQVNGANPWHPPSIAASEPNAKVARAIMHDPPIRSPYGPTFVAFESLLVRIVRDSQFSTWVWIHRALALAAACAITALIRGPRIALWGLNPLVLMSFAIAGHNDAFMLLLVSLAMRVRLPLASGILLGLAASVKLPALASPYFAKRSLVLLIGAAIGVAVPYALFPHALSFQSFVTQAQHNANSPVSALEHVLRDRHVRYASIASFAIVGAFVALVLLRTKRTLSRRNAAAAGCLILFAFTPGVHSWYFTWPLLSAAWASGKTRTLVVVASGLAWALDAGTVMTRQIHASTLVFWIPIFVLSLALFGSIRPNGRLQVEPSL